jgi:hypothetical protein
MLSLEAVKPCCLIRTSDVFRCSLGHGAENAAMPSTHGFRRPGIQEAVQTVLADRLEQSISGYAVTLLGEHE